MRHFYGEHGKVAGTLVKGIYYSRRSMKKHLLVLLDAWGIDERILEQLKEEGCFEIRILDLDTGNVYSSTLKDFAVDGIPKDFNHNKQVFLPIRYWKKEKAK